MQKEDIVENSEEDIEQVEDIVTSKDTTASQVVTKLCDESTPVEKRNYVSYFMTLEERRDVGMMLKYKNVKPEALNSKVVGALSSLFVNNKVHLYLPWWSDKRNPIDFYELRFSSNGAGVRKFADPYDPILIRREKHNEIVAVVYEGYIFRRDATPMLLELFEEMANDPAEFFERVGKRWGRCLCCKKEITADKSIERAIGPVCYKRIKKVVKFVTQVKEEIEIDSLDVVIAPTARALNPIEYGGVVALSNMYLGALKCGFEFDPCFGALLMPNETGDRRYCGELTEVELDGPKYRHVGRAQKKCISFRVTDETPHTISALTQLNALWDNENKVWLVLKDHKQKLGSYFRIKWILMHKRRSKATNSSITSSNATLSSAVTINTTNTMSNAASTNNKIASTTTTAPSITTPAASTTTTTQKIHAQLADGRIELSGTTYPYRTLIRNLGGEWDKNRKVWLVPIESRDKVDELMRKINN
jgi:hypothetical protein